MLSFCIFPFSVAELFRSFGVKYIYEKFYFVDGFGVNPLRKRLGTRI